MTDGRGTFNSIGAFWILGVDVQWLTSFAIPWSFNVYPKEGTMSSNGWLLGIFVGCFEISLLPWVVIQDFSC